LLDISTVVEFGSAVRHSFAEDSSLRLRDSSLHQLSGLQDENPEQTSVKPLIVTPRTLPPASSDYARTFDIEVVNTEPLDWDEPKRYPTLENPIPQLTDRLISSLKHWDDRFTSERQLRRPSLDLDLKQDRYRTDEPGAIGP
jgi:hypothetical protein